MKVWLIKTGEETPHDKKSRLIRTGQLFVELSRKHEIIWFNSSFNHQKKKQRYLKTTSVNYKFNSKIIYLFGNQYKTNISFQRYKSQILNVIEFIKELKKNLNKPDIIISSYPTVELAFIACMFAKKNKIPFIIDIRDMWPDILLSNLGFFKRIVFLPMFFIWKIMFNYILSNSNSIISISREFLDWSLRQGNISFDNNKHKFFHFTKQKSSRVSKKNVNPDVINKVNFLPGNINIVFAGSVSKRHNFKIIFNSLIKKEFNNINLIFCGAGELFKQYKKEYSSYQNILFLDWLNEIDLDYVLTNCHYGLLPYYGDDFDKSYPNKLAEYLLNNLKVICCDNGIVSNLIRMNHIGFHYKKDSISSFSKVLKQLTNKKSNRPFGIYKKIFNYETILKKNIKHIENIFKINNNE